MAECCGEDGVEIWSYCLGTNHVHLIAVPKTEDGLRRAIAEAHRRHTRRIHFRENWPGHLWQGRYASFVTDEASLLTAASRRLGASPRVSKKNLALQGKPS
ncbi:MAG: transposase [Thermogutta sp.]